MSPGTLTDGTYLDAREPLFLMAIVAAREPGPAAVDVFGVALLDLSTGEFRATEYAGVSGTQALADELSVLRPREMLVPRGTPLAESFPEIAALAARSPRRTRPGSTSRRPSGRSWSSSASTASTASACATALAATRAAGGLLGYLRDTHKADLGHVHRWRSARRPTPCASTP